MLVGPRLIPRRNRRTRSVPCRQSAQPRRKRLQFANDRLAAHFMLDRHVANFPEQLLIDATDRIAKGPDQFRLALCFFRQPDEHLINILMYSSHLYLAPRTPYENS